MPRKCNPLGNCGPRTNWWKDSMGIDWYAPNDGGGPISDDFTNEDGQELWWGLGDSTMQGSNNNTGPGPDPQGAGLYIDTNGVIQTIGSTDLPGSVNGSIFPQFCIDRFASTGKKPVILNSGVGGTKFFGTWNGVSAGYVAQRNRAVTALTTVGVQKLRVLISCGINDGQSGDSLAQINTDIGNLIADINTTFNNPPIYIIMFGVASTGGTRWPIIRGYIREWTITHSNVEICMQYAPFNDWGLYSADGIHLSQTGQNRAGAMLSRYLNLSSSYSKWAKSIINSFYSDLSTTQEEAINTFVNSMLISNYWHNTISFFWYDTPHKNDVFVDWGLINTLIDNAFVYNPDANITTNTSQSARMNISPTNNTYRFSKSDLAIGARIANNMTAVGAAHYLMGISSGSNVLGIDCTAAGQLRGFLYDLSLGLILAENGGFVDNTLYSIGRNGTDKFGYINGSQVDTESGVAVGADLTNGIQVGGRYTAGPTLFINSEFNYSFVAKQSAFSHAALHSAGETLITAFT